MASNDSLGTGRRKTSSARVFLKPGKGAITVKHQNISVLEGPTEGVQAA